LSYCRTTRRGGSYGSRTCRGTARSRGRSAEHCRTAAKRPFSDVHLPSFPMRRMFPAPRAELRQLDAVRIVLPVLRRRVRARPAGRARERQDRSVVFGHLPLTPGSWSPRRRPRSCRLRGWRSADPLRERSG